MLVYQHWIRPCQETPTKGNVESTERAPDLEKRKRGRGLSTGLRTAGPSYKASICNQEHWRARGRSLRLAKS